MKLKVTGYFLLSAAALLCFFSCKKQEEVVVSGNQAPPDQTVSNVIIEDYINKVYISVLGREADSTEFAGAKSTLKSNNVSSADRITFLNSVFSQPAYKPRMYNLVRNELLQDLDTNDITTQIAIINFVITTVPAYAIPYYQEELKRLDSLRVIPKRYNGGTINIIEVHKRCLNNYFYDQINMGTANFVISAFQHFLNRYPTVEEETYASTMVDGYNSTLFYQNGGSKTDFLNVFFNSNDYFEGQVVNMYKRFLFRSPSIAELTVATEKYKMGKDYEQLQKDILITNEYIGIK